MSNQHSQNITPNLFKHFLLIHLNEKLKYFSIILNKPNQIIIKYFDSIIFSIDYEAELLIECIKRTNSESKKSYLLRDSNKLSKLNSNDEPAANDEINESEEYIDSVNKIREQMIQIIRQHEKSCLQNVTDIKVLLSSHDKLFESYKESVLNAQNLNEKEELEKLININRLIEKDLEEIEKNLFLNKTLFYVNSVNEKSNQADNNSGSKHYLMSDHKLEKALSQSSSDHNYNIFNDSADENYNENEYTDPNEIIFLSKELGHLIVIDNFYINQADSKILHMLLKKEVYQNYGTEFTKSDSENFFNKKSNKIYCIFKLMNEANVSKIKDSNLVTKNHLNGKMLIYLKLMEVFETIHPDDKINDIDFKLILHEIEFMEDLVIENGEVNSLNQDVFKLAKNLKRLNLASNRLDSFQGNEFSLNLSNLIELNLSKNKIKHDLNVNLFKDLKNLKRLNLQQMGLKDIYEYQFSGLVNLEYMDLSLNDLVSLNENIFLSDLNNLKELNLAENEINYLSSEAFKNLSSLELLNLSSNRLNKFDSAGLVNLKHLDLNKNSFNDSNLLNFKCLKSLIELNLNSNQLADLNPNAFESMANLKKLNLMSNKLTQLKANQFKNLGHLSLLELSNNNLSAIDANAFVDLANLVKLNLSMNKLSNLSASLFKNQNQLEDLNFYNNKISQIEIDSFVGLSNLKVLWLNNNDLEVLVDNQFKHLSNLNELNLSWNKIHILNENAFLNLKNLKFLYLEMNQFKVNLNENSFSFLYKILNDVKITF